MADHLEPLEQRVMEVLLAGDDPMWIILAEQLDRAHVSGRELTGVGFFTSFAVPADAPRLDDRRLLHVGNVCGEIEGLGHGAGFVLHVDDGVVLSLEGYTYDEPWPTQIGKFRVWSVE